MVMSHLNGVLPIKSGDLCFRTLISSPTPFSFFICEKNQRREREREKRELGENERKRENGRFGPDSVATGGDPSLRTSRQVSYLLDIYLM